MAHRPRHGFTLIELLVVITIVVVLLALLTPALDKAIYQAELAVCGAQLRAVCSGAVTYAASAKRRYPKRRLVGPGGPPPNTLVDPIFAQADDRPVLRTFLNLNTMLTDPLTEQVNLDSDDPEISAWASYLLFFGVQYVSGGQPQAPMAKIGDRWAFNDARDAEDNSFIYRSTLLASDIDKHEANNNFVAVSHPDDDGVVELRAHDGGRAGANLYYQGQYRGATPGALKTAVAMWYNDTTRQRGLVDLNFSYQDVSVTLVDRIEWDADRRVIRIPHRTGGGQWPNRWDHLPRR